jgi:predicted alpha/beta-hydrolase family hydrolase
MRSRLLPLPLLLGCLLVSPARSAEPELTALSITVRGKPCSALLLRPADARALLVLAHGQVMSIHHPFMEAISAALARRGVATLRFNFPYAEAKRSQPDAAPLLIDTVQAAAQEGERLRGTLPLLVGGKSVGAMMAARAAGEGRLPGAKGIVILSYPLHAPGRPSGVNARALDGVTQPMLFVQGTRDPLADRTLITALVEKIGKNATLHEVQQADHSFALPEGSGRSQAEVYEEVADAIAAFTATLAPSQGG